MLLSFRYGMIMMIFRLHKSIKKHTHPIIFGEHIKMRTKSVMPIILAVAIATLLVTPAFAARTEKFKQISDGLVVRLPQKASVSKPFNIGIYVDDSLFGNSGGDYDQAVLYISVSGPEGSTCIMWNDWFEIQGLTIDEDDDLIVAPYEVLVDPDGTPGSGDEYKVYYYSMEYDEAVSKLNDIAGWTGNVVCLVNMAGDYTFTLTTDAVSFEFTVTVK
jgi:hypothetical protein